MLYGMTNHRDGRKLMIRLSIATVSGVNREPDEAGFSSWLKQVLYRFYFTLSHFIDLIPTNRYFAS